MKWAIKNNKKIHASPKSIAKCPICKEPVIAKCGDINIWHWAHKSKKDCDPWAEPESLWHINWKNEFPKEQQEVTIKQIGQFGIINQYDIHGNVISKSNVWFEAPENYVKFLKNYKINTHRADILTKENLIIELQNSPLSSEEINERENFYKNMIWLLNGKTLCRGIKTRNKNGIITFRWKHPPKSWWEAKKPIYIDFSDTQQEEGKWIGANDYMDYDGYYKHVADKMNREIFLIKKIYHNIPCGGWGILMSKQQFLNEVKNGDDKRN